MSSPIAHAAAAYAIYIPFRTRLQQIPFANIPPKLAWPLTVLFLSLLPDLDIIASLLLGSVEKYHNNISHSIPLNMFAALTMTILGRLTVGLPVQTGLTLTGTCCLTHILIDFFTRGRGIMLFWPLTDTRFHPPFALLIGVPWSSHLTSPLYMRMLAEDLLFALIVISFVKIAGRHSRF